MIWETARLTFRLRWKMILRPSALPVLPALRRYATSSIQQHPISPGPTSPVARGTAFELLTLRMLRRHGLSLRRVGGADDRGVDLRGQWDFCSTTRPMAPSLPAIVQCKDYETARAGPALIRELEGTAARESPGTVAVFACSAGFSQAAVAAAFASLTPIALVVVAETGISRMTLNRALTAAIPGLVVYKGSGGLIELWLDTSMISVPD
ncbi:hypothetical protein HDU87_007387 [Geranomyces variabilis]|uniref:Restriction endonuclease type IV Mrr domain-containing protein n=1 Tax=Geranomyces variabilis TaxID=109894 RepID=A0AAD5TRF8_9FUNG|nr:hypothetical protein HDU87_007387 [Geranomyces variabilis]